MSEFGDAAIRRLLPLLLAPSIVYVLPPNAGGTGCVPPRGRPSAEPAESDVLSTYPCDTCVCASFTFTPGEKRESVMGMFENIGSASTSRLSKLAPDDTVLVSSNGDSPRTVITSVMAPTSSVNGMFTCCPTPSTIPVRVAVLNPANCTLTL